MKQSKIIGLGSGIVILLLLGVFLNLELPRVQAATYDCVNDQSVIPQAECEALVALYNSTDGDNWSNTDKYWLVGTDPCAWYGIDCGSGGDHVIQLNLYYKGLVGEIPAELSNLTNIQNLNLSSNQLTGGIPPEIGNLSSLRYLYLSTNPLSGSIPLAMTNLALTTVHFEATNLCEPNDATYTTWKNNMGKGYYGTGTCQNLYVRSAAPYDGDIFESGENTSVGGAAYATDTIFWVGDDNMNKQIKAVLHFNTSGVPDDAVISKVSLRAKQSAVIGANPLLTHGYLIVDVDQPYFGTATALQPLDFQDTSDMNLVCTLRSTASGWHLCNVKVDAFEQINLTGNTQLRLRFQVTDNNDFSANAIEFYSGDVATANLRPILTVMYYVP